MRNSLLNPVFNESAEATGTWRAGEPWRVYLLGVGFSLGLVAILYRVSQVQTELPDAYLTALQATTTEDAILPATDGRILTDSQVLAEDEEHCAVQLHYRWLQEVPDDGWLKLQVRQRLNREERRDDDLVRRTEQRILYERDTMLSTLSSVTGTPAVELQATRQRIEQKIQKIIRNVNSRTDAGPADEALISDEDTEYSSESAGWLFRCASAIREALTTPPSRNERDRIIVREEESWHTVLDEIPATKAALISEHPERFPGVRILTTTRRTYPQPDVAVHLVGARTRNSSADAPTSAGDTNQERHGRFGVEKSYEHRIAGIPGLQRTIRDRRQRIVSTERVREPIGGRDVLLTIDLQLQLLAEQLLAEALGDSEHQLLLSESESEAANSDALVPPEPEHIPVGGSVVVMEADTGRLLALASAPEFDLTMFSHGTEEQWLAVNNYSRRPFVSRFLAMAIPPGSTWKIVTALAGLQTQTITPQFSFDCQGFLKNPDEHRCLLFRLHGRGHGAVNLKSALAQSCNVYFFDAAVRMGTEPLVQWSERLEFGQPTGIDLPFERGGTVPQPPDMSAARSESARKRFEREAAGIAIGQSRLTVTPLQMARLMAFVSNGGWLVTPHVVSEEGTSRRVDQTDDAPRGWHRTQVAGVLPESLTAIREGLFAAVEDPMGTGFRTIRVPGVRIAGKTGTAESSPGKPDHAWFTGYYPADRPRYVVVVALEHGGSGGRAAGPLARELVRSMRDRGMLQDAAFSVSGADSLTPPAPP